jgi:hypothetical protein
MVVVAAARAVVERGRERMGERVREAEVLEV